MAIELHDRTTPAAGPRTPLFANRSRVSDAERMFLTEQLELLLGTGVSLHVALEALRDQAVSPALTQLLTRIAADVSSGSRFSQALAQHPQVFSTTYVNLVAAGENGGFVHDVLGQLREMDGKRRELAAMLSGALSYPLFLATFSLAVVVFILVVVFPKFGQMFVSIRDQLPPTTLALMWASDTIRAHWPLLLGGLAVALFAARRWLVSATGRRLLDGAKLTVPGVRDVFVSVYLVQILRIMGQSVAHGVSVLDTLGACRGVASNARIEEFLADVERRVREGGSFAAAFCEGAFLPPLVRQMIRTGDETGNLGPVMLRIADYYERELDKLLKQVSRVAEPLMLLIMGAIVGVLVSSLILPIFKLTRAVG